MAQIEEILAAAGQYRKTHHKPFITLSYAQSLDGSIAANRGVPLSLSGEEAWAFTHHLRSLHQAILVGVGTVLSDDPHLTARIENRRDPQPVVLDSRLRFPEDANLLKLSKKYPLSSSNTLGSITSNPDNPVCIIFIDD